MGKSSKHRPCPATGGTITAAECGSGRGSKYTCPAHCPHFPFAPSNYEQVLAMEDECAPRVIDRLAADANDPQELVATLRRVQRAGSTFATPGLIIRRAFAERDEAGRSMMDRWLADPTARFRNDERVMLTAMSRGRFTLLESRGVHPSKGFVEMVDLLAPADSPPIIVQDRAFSAQAVRFGAVLAWISKLPHYSRPFGVVLQIQDISLLEPVEVVSEIARHLGGPAGVEGLSEWLALNSARLAEALEAVGLARRVRLLESADSKFGKALYELRAGFAECRETLDAIGDVEPDPLDSGERDEGFAEGRVWLDDGTNPALASIEGRRSLGRVLLGQSHWRLQAFGEEPLANLRRRFETVMGDRVQFTGERLDNLAVDLAAKSPRFDPALVPPRLLENCGKLQVQTSRVPESRPGETNEDRMARYFEQHARASLDEPIPLFDGKTPRDAVKEPALRLRVVRWCKGILRQLDEANLRKGRMDTMDWLADELGLDELRVPPPPFRRPRSDPEVDDDFEDSSNFAEDPSLRPPAPRLSGPAWEVEEAGQRISQCTEWFPKAEDATTEVDASGSEILDFAFDFLGDDDLADLRSRLLVVLIRVHFAFVPPGCRAPETPSEELAQSFGRRVGDCLNALKLGKEQAFEGITAGARQPVLLALASSELVFQSDGLMPAQDAEEAVSVFKAMLILRVVIDALDEALRD